MKPARDLYDCSRCPAYCCSYPRVEVKRRDIVRLAKHFGIGEEAAWRRFTKAGEGKNKRVLRHKADEIFGSVCRFLDSESRQCTVHKVRPGICRDYPGARRCGYYELLKFERRAQEDPEYVVEIDNA